MNGMRVTESVTVFAVFVALAATYSALLVFCQNLRRTLTQAFA
jgi:hypothetical protein